MWGFVEGNWNELEPIAGKPEFLRVVVQRLASSLSQQRGVERMTEVVFGAGSDHSVAPDKVHPAELYIMLSLSSKTNSDLGIFGCGSPPLRRRQRKINIWSSSGRAAI